MKKIKQLIERTEKSVRSHGYLLRPFLTLFGIYLLAISSILIANVHYADDVGRTNFGYAGWINFSRYLTSITARFLHADNYLVNIAPLPQILSVAVLAAASVMLVCIVSGKEVFKQKWTKWIGYAIAVTPLALCPYMLECLSYQYDSVYMAISVFAAILPFAFRKAHRWRYAASIIVCTLVVCMTYQASAGMFIALTVFLALKDWGDGKQNKLSQILSFVLWSAGAFLVALLLFQKVLMIPQTLYVSNEMPQDGALISTFVGNMKEYLRLVLDDFKHLWLGIIAVIAAIFAVVYVASSKRNKLVAAPLVIVSLVLMVIGVYAPYSVLSSPLFETRAMYGIGIVLTLISLFTVHKLGKRIYIALPVFALAWCFFSFSFAYGNILKEQDKYKDFQVQAVLEDINDILPSLEGEEIHIQTVGSVSYAPAIRNMPKDTRDIMQRLIRPNTDVWSVFIIEQASGYDRLVYDMTLDMRDRNYPLVKDAVLYSLYAGDDGVIVEFKPQVKSSKM